MTNMKSLEVRVLAHAMMAPFIGPDLLDYYALEVEDLWGDYSATGVNLFKHWYKTSLQREILFQRGTYDNFLTMMILLVFNGRWNCW